MDRYKIICFTANNGSWTVRGLTNLSLADAKDICGRADSSYTGTSASARRRTQRYGRWFYGFTKR